MQKIIYLHGFASSGASGTAWFDGEHRVNDDVMKHAILPKILEMLNQ